MHNVCSLLLLANYVIGSSMLNISKGYNWKDMLEKEQIVTGWAEWADWLLFLTLKTKERDPIIHVPNSVWNLFFFLSDKVLLYYITYVAMSVLGTTLYLGLFCYHVIDVAVRLDMIKDIITSFGETMDQVFATLLFGVLLVWVFTVIGFSAWGWASTSTATAAAAGGTPTRPSFSTSITASAGRRCST